MEQGRWISYIFRLDNGLRGENAGFVKVQKISARGKDTARIQIGMKLYKAKECGCEIFLMPGKNRISEIRVRKNERDLVNSRIEIPWVNAFDMGLRMNQFEGVLIVCDDGEKFASEWVSGSSKSYESDLKIQTITLPEEVNEPKQETYKEISKSEQAAGEQAEADTELDKTISDDAEIGEQVSYDAIISESIDESEEAKEKDDNMQNSISGLEGMLSTYPKLPIMAGSPYTLCVKITPWDIGKLAMGNWKLGMNSFLSHGYYQYKYIMLGKVNIKNKEKTVIGVPGVFTNKEKYMANLFGFQTFIPVKKTMHLNGNFGYWVWEVSKV